jgi:hypothetical protein
MYIPACCSHGVDSRAPLVQSRIRQLTSVDPNVRHRIFETPTTFFRRLNRPFAPRIQSIHEAFWASKESAESGLWDYANREPIFDRRTITSLLASRPVMSGKMLASKQRQDGARATSPEEPFDGFDLLFLSGPHDERVVWDMFNSAMHVVKDGACVIIDGAGSDWPGTLSMVKALEKTATQEASGSVVYAAPDEGGIALFRDSGYFAGHRPWI